MLGNLIENAAKYGGGSVFVTVGAQAGFVEFLIEDDGRRHPRGRNASGSSTAACGWIRASRGRVWGWRSCATWRRFTMARFALEESEDLGGLMVRLRLPAAN